MRKLLIPLIVLVLAGFLNAGMVDLVISGLNGEPITPVQEITIRPGDWITFDVVYTADTGWYLNSLWLDMTIEGPNADVGRLSITDPDTGEEVIYWPPGYWSENLRTLSLINDGYIYIDVLSENMYSIPGTGEALVVLGNFLYQAVELGDVSLVLNEPNLPIPYFANFDYWESDGECYFLGFGPGLVVHQVYEPDCWDCSQQSWGDTNGDGKVSSTDYFRFKTSYGTGAATHPHGTGVGHYNCCCDFNHDLKVSAADYFIFKKNYGKTCPCTCINMVCP